MAQALIPVLINAAVGVAINYLLAPDGPDVEGPRLAERGVQTNSYGAPISVVYGKMVVAGTLVYLENNELKETKHKEDTGGKGGGGGSVTTFTYSMTGAIAICEGEIDGVGRIWADAVLVSSSVNTSSNLSARQKAFLKQSGGSLNISDEFRTV